MFFPPADGRVQRHTHQGRRWSRSHRPRTWPLGGGSKRAFVGDIGMHRKIYSESSSQHRSHHHKLSQMSKSTTTDRRPHPYPNITYTSNMNTSVHRNLLLEFIFQNYACQKLHSIYVSELNIATNFVHVSIFLCVSAWGRGTGSKRGGCGSFIEIPGGGGLAGLGGGPGGCLR